MGYAKQGARHIVQKSDKDDLISRNGSQDCKCEWKTKTLLENLLEYLTSKLNNLDKLEVWKS